VFTVHGSNEPELAIPGAWLPMQDSPRFKIVINEPRMTDGHSERIPAKIPGRNFSVHASARFIFVARNSRPCNKWARNTQLPRPFAPPEFRTRRATSESAPGHRRIEK
jgi:hypothetical protein